MTDLRTAADAALRAGAQTPAYLYDLAEIRASAARLRAALPDPALIYYSLKANPHPAVTTTLRGCGMRAEACSPGELDAALGAGWAPSQVLYTGPGKRDADVAAALRAGVREFCADSPAALDQLDTLAGAAGVSARSLVRVNEDQPTGSQGLAMTGVASQFGADAGWILAEPARFASRQRIQVTGLHFYTGTNLSSVSALLAQFARSLKTAAAVTAALAAAGTEIQVIDLGGGFGAPFAVSGPPADLTGLRDGLARLLDSELAGWRAGRPRLAFESGRYLVGTAGTLLARVLDVKQSHGKDVAILESGIHHLGGMSGLRRLPPLNPSLVHAREPRQARPVMVTGPLCTPLDCWSPAASLPPLCRGDLLAVPNVGAYGLYASLVAFLGHPMPDEVVVDGSLPPSVSRLCLTRRDMTG